MELIAVEIHKDAIGNKNNVLLIDDVLATGGTVSAAIDLLENFNCDLLECLFLLELSFLKGSDKILNRKKNIFLCLKYNYYFFFIISLLFL